MTGMGFGSFRPLGGRYSGVGPLSWQQRTAQLGLSQPQLQQMESARQAQEQRQIAENQRIDAANSAGSSLYSDTRLTFQPNVGQTFTAQPSGYVNANGMVNRDDSGNVLSAGSYGDLSNSQIGTLRNQGYGLGSTVGFGVPRTGSQFAPNYDMGFMYNYAANNQPSGSQIANAYLGQLNQPPAPMPGDSSGVTPYPGIGTPPRFGNVNLI